MDSITITVFLFVLLISCFVTFFAVKAILKKDLIGTLKISPDKKEKLYRHKKAVVMIAKTVMTVYVVTAMIFIIVPGILDVPRVFTGNYERKLCTVDISYEYKTDLWVHLTDVSGAKLELMVLDSSYEKGEQYMVCYLPHIKFGTLVTQ